MRRLARAALVTTLCIAALGAWPLTSIAQTQREILAEAVAQSFTLRTAVDQGGAATLPFFFGTYADATLLSPPGTADGQASFYNLGIAETALFTPPGECTPDEQQKRAQQAVQDVTTFMTDTAIPTLMNGDIPVLEIPTLPCSERLPGFAQSRYPATETIRESSQQDLLGSALCGASACPVAEALAPLTGDVLHGGRFVAKATEAPSQVSDATILGINLPGLLTIGSARSVASAVVEKDRMTLRSTWAAADVCLRPSLNGCSLFIGSIRQSATIVRDVSGKVMSRGARTVLAGVEGGGQAREITTGDLGPGLPPIELAAPNGRGSLRVRVVSATGGCGDAAKPDVADSGGIEIFGKGSGTGVSLPLPLVGTASGGGLTLGGACVSGRLSEASFDVPGGRTGGGSGGTPGTNVSIPPGPAGPGSPGGQILSAPRVIRKSQVRYELRAAPAWRTAPYWASSLGAVLLLGVLAFVFRRTRYVAPVAAAADRFARQFVKG